MMHKGVDRRVMKPWIVFVSVIVALSCVVRVSSFEAACKSRVFTRQCLGRKSRVRGVNVDIYLFNIRSYREKVLPAYKQFFRKNDPELLITLLRECIEELNSNPQLSKQLLWDKESIEEDIGILMGTVYYSPDGGYSSNQGEKKESHKVRRDYAREVLSSNILQILCVSRDKRMNPQQDMTNTPLITYLYEKSEWIKDLFTFVRPVKGGRLELAIGESSEFFTKEDVQRLSVELSKVPPPEDYQLRKEYNNLRAMLNVALEDPNLTLVLSIG
jgi:hypothetical protein